MKTRSHLDPAVALVARPVLLAILTCLWVIATFTLSAQDNRSSAQKITSTRVFSQPIIWTGEQPPTEADSIGLARAIETFTSDGTKAGIAALENFIARNANSPWTPSLRANLGKYYLDRARYTPALDHWQTAWEATKNLQSEGGKATADFTVAHLSRLLGNLGRIGELRFVLNESKDRQFADPVLAQHYQATRLGLHRMFSEGDLAYRCGSFALEHVGMKLKGKTLNRKPILEARAPESGFSMRALQQLSEKTALDLVPVQRIDNSQLVVPSVVHLQQQHYVAIVDRRGDLYKVVDATFMRPKWLTAEIINAEASGYFMVPRNQSSADRWRVLNSSETARILGRGYRIVFTFEFDCEGNLIDVTVSVESLEEQGNSNSANQGNSGCQTCSSVGAAAQSVIAGPPAPDPNPGGCPNCGGATGTGGPGNGFWSGGSGSPFGENSGRTFGLPGRSAGMPQWGVSQPYTSLWITDTPLFYNTPLNGTMFFKLQAKQNQTRPTTTNIFGFGKIWHANIHGYLKVIDLQEDPDYAYYEATYYSSDGSERQYLWDDTSLEFYSRTKMERKLDQNQNLAGFRITYVDGSVAEFTHLRTNLVGELEAFLSSNSDRTGKGVVTLNYQTTNDVVRLTSVVDATGGTNIFRYDTNRIHLVTEIENPYGQKAQFAYNSADYLTNITDMINLSSSFSYDANGWITNLATPYGATTFSYAYDHFAIGPAGTDSRGWRRVEATQPNGAKHLYIYRSTVTHPSQPDQELFRYATFDEYGHYNTFNSVYFGPRQYMLLSTTNYSQLSSNDFHLASHKLWKADLVEPWDYEDWFEPYFDPSLLLVQRAPSPDGGLTEGQKWFHTYDAGQSVPRKTWWLMPDGTTNYVEYIRNQTGYPTNLISVWTRSDGTLATRTNKYEYAENGIDLVRMIGPDGHAEAGLSYNADHQVLTFTNAVGDATLYTYNTNGQITSVSLPTGLTTTNIYDANGWLEKTIELEIGRTNTFTWTNGLLHAHLNECGLAITNTWDPLNRLTSRAFPDGTTVSNVYDKLDLMSTKDRLGNWTHRGFDSMQRVTAVTNALGNVTSYAYCPCGSLEYITNALGQVTTFLYDTAGRRTAVLQPDNSATAYSFDKLGRLLSTTDAMGVSVTNYYNHQGLVVNVSNAFGRVKAIAYDSHDHATNIVDANGISVSMTYDDLGRVLTRTYPDTGVERYGYSARGLIAYTNQLGKVTTYGYDAAGRKIAETNANNEVITFTYSASGEMLTLTDGKNQTTTWNYDEYCQVTNKVDTASTEVFRYAYNANGNLTNRWTAAKGNTAYAYDAAGNLTNVNYAVSPNIAMAYDALNRLTNMVDAVGATRYGYTVTGRLEFEDGPWDDDTVTYDYHANGQRKSVGLPGPHGGYWLQSYAYDAAKRLSSITSPAGAFGYEYTGAPGSSPALVHKLHLPGGSRIVNSYDDVARLTSTKLLNSATNTLNLQAYLYNAGGQRTKQTFTDGNYVDYTYDDIGQLKGAKGSESGGGTRAHEQFGYAYDAAGNLNWRTNNALVQDFNVNTLNQLTNVGRSGTLTVAGKFEMGTPPVSVAVNGQSASVYADLTFARSGLSLADGTNNFTAIATDNASQSATNAIDTYLPASASFQYDSNGNLLSDGKRAFAYDDENQLASVLVTNQWKSEFVYDGKLRRRIRKEYTWDNDNWQLTEEVLYVYDSKLVIQERDGNNAARVSYTRGRDLSGSLEGAGGIGGMLARSEISNLPSAITTHAFYHSDGNGNVAALVNPEQVVVAQYHYDPYGNVLAKSGTLADANLYRFSSKEFHEASGLAYYLYRYYSPELQRWLNRDPIAEFGGVNLYIYVANNPLTIIDPLGLSGWYYACVAACSVAVTAAIAAAGVAIAGSAVLTVTVTVGASSMTLTMGGGLILGTVCAAACDNICN